MFVKIVDGEVRKVKNMEDTKTLEVVAYVFPLANAGNNYYDGIVLRRGNKHVKVTEYGGGDGWARRGSMSEAWEKNLPAISVREFDTLLEKITSAMKVENEIDHDEEIALAAREILNRVGTLEDD